MCHVLLFCPRQQQRSGVLSAWAAPLFWVQGLGAMWALTAAAPMRMRMMSGSEIFCILNMDLLFYWCGQHVLA